MKILYSKIQIFAYIQKITKDPKFLNLDQETPPQMNDQVERIPEAPHVTLRPATEADISAIATLQKENQKELIPDAEWKKLVEETDIWDANDGLSWAQRESALASVIDLDRTIIVETDNGDVIGYLLTLAFEDATTIRYSIETIRKIERVIGSRANDFNIDPNDSMCCGQILILEEFQGTRLTKTGHLISKSESNHGDKKLMHAMYEFFDRINSEHVEPYHSRIADVASGDRQNGKSMTAHLGIQTPYHVLGCIDNLNTENESYSDNVMWRKQPKRNQIFV